MASSRNRGKQNGTGGITVEESHLEALNESMAESLSSKVGQLKSLALDLETESHDHLPLLDGFDDSFETGFGRLTGTYNRLRVMGRGNWTSGRRLVFAVAGLTLGMLLVLYLISRYR